MTENFDIIPDIHAQYYKLEALLKKLGWCESNNIWEHEDPKRRIVFLGDFIDRGVYNGKVLQLIKTLIKLNKAYAILGNHELNAIYFHSKNKFTGNNLRQHSIKNIDQHQTFLDEFPYNDSRTKKIIKWFCTLPLFIDFKAFRVVHACWSTKSIATISGESKKGIFSQNKFIEIASLRNELYYAIERIAKGPELKLNGSNFFLDKSGLRRQSVRLAWWLPNATKLRELAISVPNLNEIPNLEINSKNNFENYGGKEVPVFFGHYWMTAPPKIYSQNAICLDCSAGLDGPLVSYHWKGGSRTLSFENITIGDTLDR